MTAYIYRIQKSRKTEDNIISVNMLVKTSVLASPLLIAAFYLHIFSCFILSQYTTAALKMQLLLFFSVLYKSQIAVFVGSTVSSVSVCLLQTLPALLHSSKPVPCYWDSYQSSHLHPSMLIEFVPLCQLGPKGAWPLTGDLLKEVGWVGLQGETRWQVKSLCGRGGLSFTVIQVLSGWRRGKVKWCGAAWLSSVSSSIPAIIDNGWLMVAGEWEDGHSRRHYCYCQVCVCAWI